MTSLFTHKSTGRPVHNSKPHSHDTLINLTDTKAFSEIEIRSLKP